MTEKQLKKREAELEKAGYHKSLNTSSTNDYSWFKTIKDPNDDEEWLYMIEWQVWNWLKYADRDPDLHKRPYSMSLAILANNDDSSSTGLRTGDDVDIATAEKAAAEFYEFTQKYFKKP